MFDNGFLFLRGMECVRPFSNSSADEFNCDRVRFPRISPVSVLAVILIPTSVELESRLHFLMTPGKIHQRLPWQAVRVEF